MSELDDLDITPSGSAEEVGGPDFGGPRRGFPTGLVVGLVLLVALVAGVAYRVVRRLPSPRPSPAASAAATIVPSPGPSPTTSVDLPPLDGSDALVRQLARELSSDPQLGVWLSIRGIIRTLVVVAENIADGQSPREPLAFLAPRGPFAVIEKGGRLVIDPRGFARYDAFASVVASLDAAACARLYRRLEPLFEAAYRDLGHPEGGFSKKAERVLAHLQETPVVEGHVSLRRVVRGVVVYELVDPRLEGLTAPQKHLLRMGPGNVRRVKAKLGDLAASLELKASP